MMIPDGYDNQDIIRDVENVHNSLDLNDIDCNVYTLFEDLVNNPAFQNSGVGEAKDIYEDLLDQVQDEELEEDKFRVMEDYVDDLIDDIKLKEVE